MIKTDTVEQYRAPTLQKYTSTQTAAFPSSLVGVSPRDFGDMFLPDHGSIAKASTPCSAQVFCFFLVFVERSIFQIH